MKQNEIDLENFNDSPPLSNSNAKYIVLVDKETKQIFWTSGGEYRNDWYELVFESETREEAINYYMKKKFEKMKPF